MRVLVTGAAGFYGHHLVRYLLLNTNWYVVALDRIDCAGNLNRLSELDEWNQNPDRRCFIWHDLKAEINNQLSEQLGQIDIIFHVAAASHVDRSIEDPRSFVMDNVLGTCNILEFAKFQKDLKRFFYFSTDEVFGANTNGEKFKEWDRYKSGNPYSATKAGGEELALSYHNTYNLPVIITHCMNIYGERQNPEKFIPKVIRLVKNNEKVYIYGDKDGNKSGSRNYVYADTVSQALLFLNEHGVSGEKYNIEGTIEESNLAIAQMIHNCIGTDGKDFKYEIVPSGRARPGNDFSYGVDGSRLREMGFEPDEIFEEKFPDVINWYLDNEKWYK